MKSITQKLHRIHTEITLKLHRINGFWSKTITQKLQWITPKLHRAGALAETQRYAQDLRSLTQGRGEYELEFDRYEQVPPNIEQRVIEDAKRAREEEND